MLKITGIGAFWRRAALCALCLSCLCLICACGGRRTTAIIVAGSTSVQPYAEVLAEEYALLYAGYNIDIHGGGSAAGITAAASGAADIGMSSRALNEDEQYLWSVEIAKDGLALIINPQNPVLGLSQEQLRAVYAGTLVNWQDLGGPDAKIHVIAREEGSGTRAALEDLVMGTTSITPKALVQASNGAVKQLVASDPHAIGFISLGLVDATVKALSLDGVAATWDHIIDGSYFLFRPFIFVTSSQPAGQTKQFVDFVMSDAGQQILKNEGLIPVQEGVR